MDEYYSIYEINHHFNRWYMLHSTVAGGISFLKYINYFIPMTKEDLLTYINNPSELKIKRTLPYIKI